MSRFYYNENRTMVAVLVSYGYGTGWSSANQHCKDVATNHWIVRLFMDIGPIDLEAAANKEKRNRVLSCLRDIYGDGYFNLLGWMNIDIEWVPVGTKFRINEYDGSEYLEEFDHKDWIIAGKEEEQ